MNSYHRIIICFLTVVILTSMFLLVLPRSALAQTIYPGCELPTDTKTQVFGMSIDKYKSIKINFSLPGITTEKKIKNKDGYVVGTEYHVKNLPCFIIGLYTYFAGIAGILATVMMMYGGIKYVVSFGSPQRVTDAKDTIFAAITGLVLIMGSYILLNFINPNLTDLKMPNVNRVIPVLDEFWCEDQGNVVPVEVGQTNCNDRGTVKGGSKDGAECIYRECQEEGKVCAQVGGDYQFECLAPKAACEAEKGIISCKRIDRMLVKVGLTDQVCSLELPNEEDGACYLRELLTCEKIKGSKWIQVECDYNGQGQETPCWDAEENEPKYKRMRDLPWKFYCTDGRGGKGADSICCYDTGDIDCRDSCNSDEVSLVDCIGLDGVSYVGQGDACNAAELVAGKKCCMELDLGYY